MYDYIVIGGGIVGLATAMSVQQRFPLARVLVLEKEPQIATHQTGRNSGVIHSGIYYKPGSFKAKFCHQARQTMVEFCKDHGLAVDVCGKLIVATSAAELPGLQRLQERGEANGVEVERIGPERAREIEPHVHCVAALRVPSTGITDYRAVSRKYLEIIELHGGEVHLRTQVLGVRNQGSKIVVETDRGSFEGGFAITCAGLHSDRVARMFGVDPQVKIVPFRGEYYELTADRRFLVKHLIYPVPDPAFPFLGVHFTRMIDGSIHAGPNAVLSLKREGYHKTDINLRDAVDVFGFRGFWRLAARHTAQGWAEMVRSFSKAAFVRSLQQLIPEVGANDVVTAHAGVRAQAMTANGALVDDFLLVNGERSLHVCNAPSPAATCSLEIGRTIAGQVPEPS